MRNLSKVFFAVIFLIPALFVSDSLSKETYPDRPITMVVWSAPGGQGDIVTREICKVIEKELGQPIIIENKEGAAGVLGLNYILKSKPDGYTIGMAVTSNLLFQPQMRKVPYDVLTDVTDIASICKMRGGFAVGAGTPWNTWEEVVAYARKNPGKFTYAASGVGVAPHITMERIAMKEGVKWTMIPFKGGGESVLACIGGHTDGVGQASTDLVPQMQAGKLKLILTMDDSRWPEAPNVPCMAEKYDFYLLTHISYIGPKGLPEPIRQRLEDAFKKAVEDPSFIKQAKQIRIEPSFMSGKDYSAQWRSKYDDFGKVIKALGIFQE